MKIHSLLAGAMLIGCADATSPRTPMAAPAQAHRMILVNAKDSTPAEYVACNGELVVGGQIEHDVSGFTLSSSDHSTAFVTADFHITGVGSVTGVRYEGKQSIKDKSMTGDGADVYRLTVTTQLISQTSVPNTYMDFEFDAVTNGNGTVVFTTTNIRTRCQ